MKTKKLKKLLLSIQESDYSDAVKFLLAQKKVKKYLKDKDKDFDKILDSLYNGYVNSTVNNIIEEDRNLFTRDY